MESEVERTLEYTPTWAVATAASMFVIVSLLLERGIHLLSSTLKRKNQKPLRQAVHKMVEELMLLGFISLFLTAFQSPVSKICIPKSAADHWLPCKLPEKAIEHAASPETSSPELHSRKLLLYLGQFAHRKLLSTAGSTCGAKGQAPFVSLEGLHQLHIFIFVLAIVHVTYSCLTVVLGFTKMHGWKKWELQTREENYDPLTALRETFVQSRPNTCLQTHSVRGQSPIALWTRCFFGQFVGSVSKSDYLTFRLAFINNHHLTNKFNFHDYVIRSMEVDFKVVVGISWWLWAFVVVFLLLNVHDWYTYFWMAFIPLILVLVVGTKQQHIISILATESKNDAVESSGVTPSKKHTQALTVKTRDELFWFNCPGLMLSLIHFILFQNAFELAVFFWLWATFGWSTCFFERRALIFIRVFVGVLTQVLCSYSTLPLYALVNQMGSDYKPTIFKKSVHSALHGWHGKARQKQRDKAKSPERHVLESLNPLVWVARELKQVNPPSGESAPQAQEEGEQAHEEPIHHSPVPAAQPEGNDAQKAAREKFMRLYGKLGGTAKALNAGPPDTT